MACLLEERVITLEFADLQRRHPIHRPPAPLPRAPGLHQSAILAHVARSIGKLKPGEPLEEDMPGRISLGIMWEEFYFSLVPDVDWQPGELTVDGISVNADGIGSYFNEELGIWDYPCLEETKCTEKKVRTGPELMADEWMWMHQGRAYCHCYGLDTVRWTIMFYRGDWRGSGPVCKQYVIRFTPHEVRSTWDMLLNNKDGVQPE